MSESYFTLIYLTCMFYSKNKYFMKMMVIEMSINDNNNCNYNDLDWDNELLHYIIINITVSIRK